MNTNSLTLSANDYPQLASLHPGQEVTIKCEGSLRMKHLENTEEYVELNIDKVTVEEKQKMSVQEILLSSIAKGSSQNTVV